MNEIKAKKWMAFVLNPTIHVNAALFAGMALNGCLGINNRKFVFIRRNADVVSRNDGNL